jgi:hypothetical protein
MGRILIVLHPRRGHRSWEARGYRSVSVCKYDRRFQLMPKDWTPASLREALGYPARSGSFGIVQLTFTIDSGPV